MHSDTSRFGQPERPTKDKVPQEYFCNRASGLSADLQKQQSRKPENVAATVSSSISELSLETVQLDLMLTTLLRRFAASALRHTLGKTRECAQNAVK